MSGLYSELKRRNVFRVAIAYALVSWVILQIADVLFPALSLPEWAVRLVAGLLLLGLPVAVLFAWAYELTPDGLKRERDVDPERSITAKTGRRLDFVVIVVLAVAVLLFALDRFVWKAEDPADVSAEQGRSIAVLPFVNMSDETSNEYFSDGISEELLNSLARIPELRVIGRTSSFQFKGSNRDLREIGETLGVDNILEGSVRKAEDRVRITAQLISAADGSHLWSEVYERKLDDIFALQQDIATAVVAALRVQLLLGEVPSRNAPASREAYDLYLKGLFHFRLVDTANLETALAYFDRAIELDPRLAAAWEKKSSVYLNQTLSGVIPLAEGQALSGQALDRAIELDPMAADAWYQKGFRQMVFDWDWAAAESSMRTTLQIEPNHSGALSGLALLSLALNRVDEALALSTQSLQADPLRVASRANHGFIYFKSGQSQQAVEELRRVMDYSPDLVRAHYRLALALLANGDAAGALAEAELERADRWKLGSLVMIHHELGNDERSEAALAELLERFPDDVPYLIAKGYACRGDPDRAFEWFDRAYELRDPLLPWIRDDPGLAAIRNDPRFDALLQRLGLPGRSG